MLGYDHKTTACSHCGSKRLKDTIRRTYYLPRMANGVHNYVERYQSCRKHRQDPTHERLLQPFPWEGPVDFVVMDIHDPLPETKTANKFIVVLTDRWSKVTELTRAIPAKTATVTDTSRLFVED